MANSNGNPEHNLTSTEEKVQQAGVTVTLATIYDIVMVTSTDVISIKQGLGSTTASLLDHERRIRQLETRIWAAIGGFGLFAAITPFLTRLIG